MLRIPFDGYTYKVELDPADPDAFQSAVDSNRVVAATRMLLGDAQWAVFRRRHKTIGDVARFADRLYALRNRRRN